MKKSLNILLIFSLGVLSLYALKVEAVLPLTGKMIVIDAGHGGLDPGTSFSQVYEKDINLQIALYLEEYLSTSGALVILTRDGDYDLATPNAKHRKKSDFDNRIELINESNADMYVSIHLNYLSDTYYAGPQVFYNFDNLELAESIQESMNNELKGDREVKKIPSDTYMYKLINKPGVLIECGFLSNTYERNLLSTSNYQQKVAHSIMDGIITYYKK